MRFLIEEVEVLFPYEYIYPEQYHYMVELKRALDAHGHGVLEMPSGTGKTITILSFICAYMHVHPERTRLVYCTRTVPEMEKVLEELQRLMDFRRSVLQDNYKDILALGLSARKNMCVNPDVAKEWNGNVVDSKCRSLTASWVREAARGSSSSSSAALVSHDQNRQMPPSGAVASNASGHISGLSMGASTAPGLGASSRGGTISRSGVGLCSFYETLENNPLVSLTGVHTLAEMRTYGQNMGMCPYFLSRRLINHANIIVFNYQYLLDPKIASVVSKELTRDCIVVFDEAHNIDNVCIEALSVNIDATMLDRCKHNLSTLQARIRDVRAVNEERLQTEYNKLRSGLAAAGIGATDQTRANPVLPTDVLLEAVPGNIRRGEHFLVYLRRVIEYCGERLRVSSVVQETPDRFIQDFESKLQVDTKALRFCSDRLRSLFITLEISQLEEYGPLRALADFATLAGTYNKGFMIIIEPYDQRTPSISNQVLQFSCMDASLAMKPLYDKFESVIITSGTLTPLDMYPRILNFKAVVTSTFTMSLTRNCICPMVVSKGADQTHVSSQFKLRSEPAVTRNYGQLLMDLCNVVPDGIICFFVSYAYMEDIVQFWHEQGVLEKISEKKLLFFETPNTAESALALEQYRNACDSGRGAVLLSIARGKVAEGIDFDGHYGRAVIMFGIPFMYTESKILQARLKYLHDTYHIKEEDFLAFDALRQASQCIGRVIRNKTDYGLMVLADKRYKRLDKRSKLPKWITQYLDDNHIDLSVDLAVEIARRFFRDMAQPWGGHDSMLGTALWDEAIVQSVQPSSAPLARHASRSNHLQDEDDVNMVVDVDGRQ